jgi:hypothetical protein
MYSERRNTRVVVSLDMIEAAKGKALDSIRYQHGLAIFLDTPPR